MNRACALLFTGLIACSYDVGEHGLPGEEPAVVGEHAPLEDVESEREGAYIAGDKSGSAVVLRPLSAPTSPIGSGCREKCEEAVTTCENKCREIPEIEKLKRQQCWSGCNDAYGTCVAKCK